VKPLCRHCRAEPATRPRGLGWKCYYRPGVKEQYPTATLTKWLPGVPTVSAGRLPEPTTARPGTDEKVQVMAQRAEKGFALYHPADATHGDLK
jgi:hypothetical protein